MKKFLYFYFDCLFGVFKPDNIMDYKCFKPDKRSYLYIKQHYSKNKIIEFIKNNPEWLEFI